ncbi:CBS domain-containing protein [Bacillus carboniphilus]|uniref:CBS domain-containing protein n=1 Tax=Bacillus carboniphilus TaxID=86663 RepID=A0ABY9JVH9_9BACI|nr:CBS domain-containing protein [Bacillus carboniphilus]WLR42743.1 CBS domain-containing protein [Bacillus carboniphilus]
MSNIREIMSSNVACVSSQQSLQEAAELMIQYNVGSVPVVDNGKLCGIITDRDITTRATAKGKLGNTPVSEIMSTNLVSGNPNMSTEEASQLMAQNQIRRLPVVENDQIVGMVALGDLATSQYSNEAAGQALSNISQNNYTTQ